MNAGIKMITGSWWKPVVMENTAKENVRYFKRRSRKEHNMKKKENRRNPWILMN